MAIFSGGAHITDSAQGSFPEIQTEILKVGTPAVDSLSTGFTAGGYNLAPPTNPAGSNVIQSFPFAQTSGTATDVGDLAATRYRGGAASSPTDGYFMGGGGPAGISRESAIEKFPFAISGGTATDIGDISAARSANSGHNGSTAAFTTGGISGYTTKHAQIDKVPYSHTSGTLSNVANLTAGNDKLSEGATDEQGQVGFVAGGSTSPNPAVVTIEKFPFAISSGTSSLTGGATSPPTLEFQNSAEVNSSTHAFIAGGVRFTPSITTSPHKLNEIRKYPFSIASGVGQDVGDLTHSLTNHAGMHSTTNGFVVGGQKGNPSPAVTNGAPGPSTLANATEILKFPFAISSGTTTDIGDLSPTATFYINGYQG